jgi:DNA primase
MGDAVDILDRKLQILERQGYLETIEGQRRAVDGLLSTLRAVRDPALRDLYLARAAEGTGVRRQTLVSEVTRSEAEAWEPRFRPAGESPAEQELPADADALVPATERTVLVLLLRDVELIATADAEGLEAEHFRHPALRRIYESIRAEPASDGASIIARLPAADVRLYEQIRGDATEYLDWHAVLSRAIRYLATTRERAELEHYDRQIPLAEEGEQRRLLQEKDRAARDLRGKGAAPWGILRSRDGRPSRGGSA